MEKRLQRSQGTDRRRTLFCAVAWSALLLIALLVKAEPSAAGKKEPRPTLTARLSSLKAAYADLKFVFDLVGDPKGYRDFQETIDLALDGVATDRPCEVSILATADGLQTVGYLPAVTNEDFQKFLRALEDVDVRTASTIPSALRDKLKSVKLEPNERIIVSMYEGFLRFDDGYIRLGHDLEAVRRPHAIEPTKERNATATIRVDGAASPDVRQAAFDKSRQKMLARLKKEADQTDATFAFQKALIDGLLSAAGLVFAESSKIATDWSTSHAEKQSQMEVKVIPEQATSLSHELERIRNQHDAFACVSRQDAVLAISWHLPLNKALIRPLKAITKCSSHLVQEQIQASDLPQNARSYDRDVSALVFDIIGDMIDVPECNGFLRAWSNANQSLTTVGAIRITGAEQYRDRLRSLKGREVGRLDAGIEEIAIYQVIVSKWPSDLKELFDQEGALFVGVGKEAIWFGLGEGALDRMKQSITQAGMDCGTSLGMAMTLSARMHPLSKVWDGIHSRRTQPLKPKSKATDDVRDRTKRVIEEKPSMSLLKEIAADLNLSSLAVKAYQGGPDVIEVTLKQEGEQALLSARVDEGTLRFIGHTLSKFAKDNF